MADPSREAFFSLAPGLRSTSTGCLCIHIGSYISAFSRSRLVLIFFFVLPRFFASFASSFYNFFNTPSAISYSVKNR